jgi:chromate reductase, NAD(P)H dehydrogenase (quinone)
MMVFLDGRPVNKPEVMIGQAHTKFVDGKFNDEVGAKLLADLGASLVLAIRQARTAATVK